MSEAEASADTAMNDVEEDGPEMLKAVDLHALERSTRRAAAAGRRPHAPGAAPQKRRRGTRGGGAVRDDGDDDEEQDDEDDDDDAAAAAAVGGAIEEVEGAAARRLHQVAKAKWLGQPFMVNSKRSRSTERPRIDAIYCWLEGRENKNKAYYLTKSSLWARDSRSPPPTPSRSCARIPLITCACARSDAARRRHALPLLPSCVPSCARPTHPPSAAAQAAVGRTARRRTTRRGGERRAAVATRREAAAGRRRARDGPRAIGPLPEVARKMLDAALVEARTSSSSDELVLVIAAAERLFGRRGSTCAAAEPSTIFSGGRRWRRPTRTRPPEAMNAAVKLVAGGDLDGASAGRARSGRPPTRCTARRTSAAPPRCSSAKPTGAGATTRRQGAAGHVVRAEARPDSAHGKVGRRLGPRFPLVPSKIAQLRRECFVDAGLEGTLSKDGSKQPSRSELRKAKIGGPARTPRRRPTSAPSAASPWKARRRARQQFPPLLRALMGGGGSTAGPFGGKHTDAETTHLNVSMMRMVDSKKGGGSSSAASALALRRTTPSARARSRRWRRQPTFLAAPIAAASSGARIEGEPPRQRRGALLAPLAEAWAYARPDVLAAVDGDEEAANLLIHYLSISYYRTGAPSRDQAPHPERRRARRAAAPPRVALLYASAPSS